MLNPQPIFFYESNYQKLWNSFSEEEQKVLLCLVPFQTYFYYEYNLFWDYLEPLQGFHSLNNEPEHFYNIIIKARDTGFLKKSDGEVAYMEKAVGFSYFINEQFRLNSISQEEIIQSFLGYYKNITPILYNLLKSNTKEDWETFKEIMEYEHHNLYKVALLGVEAHQDIFTYYYILSKYLRTTYQYSDLLVYALRLKNAIDQQQTLQSDVPTYVSILDAIGTAYLRLEKLNEALVYFQQALVLCDKYSADFVGVDVREFRCILLTSIGACKAETNAQEALSYHKAALTLAQDLEKDNLINGIAFNLSELLFSLHFREESKQYLEQALYLSIQIGDKETELKSRRSLATNYQSQESFQTAITELEKILQTAQKSQKTKQIGRIYQELASTYYQAKNFKKSEEYCHLAIQEGIKAKNYQQQGNTYNLLSIISIEKNELEDWHTYVEKALEYFDKANKPDLMANVYSNTALQCYNLEFYEETIIEIQKAIELYQAIGYGFQEAKSTLLLTMAELALGNLKQAKDACLFALKYFVEIEDKTEIKYALFVAKRIVEISGSKTFENKVHSIVNSKK
jgi:tetratricopeptide (TPR) repeat protein